MRSTWLRLILLAAPFNLLMGQSPNAVHFSGILVDTHNDFPSASIQKQVSLDANLKGVTHTDLARLFAGGVDVQVFSIFCDGKQVQPYNWARREIDSVEAWARRNPQQLTILHSSKELFRTVKAGKIGAFMGVEGGHMIENHLEYLDTFFARGVRYMTLTWNNSTDWATSALDETTAPNLSHKGLTDFGKSVIRKMNQLGMLVDISHVGEQTFWDALSVTTKPVIASHSSVYALCPHRRNLKDDQIRAIGKNGGVIHLNFFAGFLDSTYQDKSARFTALHQAEVDSLIAQGAQADYARMMIAEKYPEELKNVRPPLELLLTHLDYVVRLVGIDHVGLGSDFDGIEAAPRELNGVENFPLLTQALLKRGYSTSDIHKILGGNFIRVLQANEKSTAQLSSH